MSHLPIPVAERFWSKVNKDGPTQSHMETACWVWTRATDKDGYGTIQVDGNKERAHRVAWLLANGTDPIGLVRHACDNSACVRPDHLLCGSTQDNVKDRVARGRSAKNGPTTFPKGEAHFKALLTEADVLEIRRLYPERAWTRYRLADRYGVSPHTISQVVGRQTWKHIPPAADSQASEHDA